MFLHDIFKEVIYFLPNLAITLRDPDYNGT